MPVNVENSMQDLKEKLQDVKQLKGPELNVTFCKQMVKSFMVGIIPIHLHLITIKNLTRTS